jgi:hypothetical protein
MSAPARYHRDALASLSPDLPWAELRGHLRRAPDEVALALEQRVESLYASGQLDQLWREVSDPRFAADALVHPAAAGAALRVTGALAWYGRGALATYGVLREESLKLGLGPVVLRVDQELLLSSRFFAMRRTGLMCVTAPDGAKVEVPDALIRVFGDRLLVAPGMRARAWRDVGSLAFYPWVLLAFFTRMVTLDGSFLVAILNRLIPEIPLARGALPLVPPELRIALERELTAVPRRSRWRKLRDVVGGAAGQREYAEHARPAIAGVLADVGVPLPVAASWLSENPRRVTHLAKYEHRYPKDLALQLCGVIAAIVHAAGREAVTPDEGASPYRAADR